MELKALPEGSRPTLCQSWSPTLPSARVRAKTLEMDWMEKPVAESPPSIRRPSAVATAMPNWPGSTRSEEHTSELQSLMRNSYAVFCLKKKKKNDTINTQLQGIIPHNKRR